MPYVVQTDAGPQIVDVAEVRIDPADIEKDMQEQAAKYAYWASVAAELVRRLNDAKLDLKTKKAQLGDGIRSGRLPMSGKTTEAAIKDRVEGDPAVVAAAKTITQLEQDIAQVNALLDGLRQRKDMLYGLALLRNSEMRSLGR